MSDNDAKVTDDIIKEALERFEESVEGSETNREDYYADTKFARMADQWPDKIKKQRIQEGRPALVINKLPSFIRSVVNESRQNKPAISVAPVDNGADEDTAEVIGGLVRSIERNSHAEIAYDTAIDHAVTGGFGFWRLAIDYAHDETFDMEILIKRIPNALMVHWDTSSTEFDASDWEYAFISDMMKKTDFEAKYPDAMTVNFEGDSRDTATEQWIDDDSIRIAEYFLRTMNTHKLYLLDIPGRDGGERSFETVREQDVPMLAKQFFKAGDVDVEGLDDDEAITGFLEMSGVRITQERDVEAHTIMRRIISGAEVLEEEEWPGSMIPICPVWGDEVYIDGRRNFRSMIRDAKDPQMMFNFWRSASTELVALAPKTPFIGPKGFVPKGQEDKWKSANTRSHAYLEYNPGERPERQPFAGVPAGALQEAANNVDDMKSIMGIFDSSLGAQSNEISGKAIMARERQGDVSNFHFTDNLSRAIRYCGQLIVELIPAVYSSRQTVRVLGNDEAVNVVKLTQEAGGSKEMGLSGKPALYNLSVGKYDVTVKTGPSFTTQREETRETLIEIMRQVPDAAPFIGDVLLDHMDFVGADKVAKRLKALLPPAVRQAEEAEEGNEDNPELAAANQKFQAYQQEVEAAKKQVMEEIKRLTEENEAIKQDKRAQTAKMQADAAAKDKELDIKSRELALKEAAVVSPEKQWEYDNRVIKDKQAFDAGENERDRQVDLAKTILNNSEEDDTPEIQNAAMAKAMKDAAEIMMASDDDTA